MQCMERGQIPFLEALKSLGKLITLPGEITITVEASCSENNNKPEFVMAEFEKHPNFIDTKKAIPV